MKKNNLKLIGSLVSLGIALLLVVIGNKNNYCLSFGFILMGFALALYTMYKTDMINSALIEIDNEMGEVPLENNFLLQELTKEKKKLNKQKKSLNFTFYLTATLLIVVGFAFMF